MDDFVTFLWICLTIYWAVVAVWLIVDLVR